ncbi:MAG: N-6 DNA methylase, partial [Chlorobi bacterium]|nr:N-6 DNA methylase [Chlorobiota bacterium]
MPLFQKSVLNKYLKEQDKAVVQTAYDRYRRYFHNPDIQENIRLSKEEQFQEGFLRELFVKVFGYVLNPMPEYNLTTEYKNEKGSKKADGAILRDGKAIGVIELKSTKTKDLESIRQQAFDYKSNQTACVYVITSNFQKIRFYINDAVEYEEFDLFILSPERFEILYLCLNSKNLLADIPLKIKNDSLLEEEKITKKFYADYSQFKKELFEDMVSRNMGKEGITKLLLYKKSQKLLDRFLFIFFAEDRGLLPPNSISRIIRRWNVLKEEDAYKSLYEIYKQYFGYLNKGRKGKVPADDIHEYNGGLFLPDKVLDKIEIGDEVLLKHTSKLTNYDFDSTVDVNILGHIFEHSLNEIESTTAELEGVDFDKQRSKRKKDGVYYTPKYITKYIVDNTVGKLCEEKKAKLGIAEDEYRPNRKKETKKRLLAKLEEYRKWLLELTICDPACGSGAFLNQALEFLINEHRFIDELNARLLGSAIIFQDVENQILEKNLYGVDINEESVDIARLSLWLRTAERGRKLTTLNKNIKCGNSLIDDPEVAGDKAFNWAEEFPEVFAEKEKKAFHITTATHDSRTSQRMIDYKVRQKRDGGTRPYAEPVWLETEDELLITKTVAGIVKDDKLNVLAFNVCGDHMHLLLVCEEEEVSKIVGKIKAVSSRTYNIEKGITVPFAATDADIDVTRGHVPLSDTLRSDTPRSDTLPSPSPSPGVPPPEKNPETAPFSEAGTAAGSQGAEKEKSTKTYNPLWTQKFGCKEIKDDEQLGNTVEYIQNNRQKHELERSKEMEAIIDGMCCTYEHAFRTEYKGGFDVVIGNPPYVQSHSI